MEERDDRAASFEDRAARPLGRGLEQISHLFLTPRQGPLRAGEPPPPVREVVPADAGTSPGSLLLMRSAPAIPKDRVVSALRVNPGVLETGLRVIDMFLSCPPHSDMDILALDENQQLTVIDVDTGTNEALCMRGLAHCEWLQRNLTTLRRLYPEVGTPGVLPPRLFLVASKFSSQTLSAARQLDRQRIRWFRFHVLETNGTAGIFFEPVTDL